MRKRFLDIIVVIISTILFFVYNIIDYINNYLIPQIRNYAPNMIQKRK